MRRLYPPLAAGLVALLLVGAWAGWSTSPARSPAVASNNNPNCRFIGVASCSAAACHNLQGPRGSKGSEYTTWATIDPHAKAFATLSKPVSRDMHKKLAQALPEMAKYSSATCNPLCL